MHPVHALTRYYADGGRVTEGDPASTVDDVHARLQHGEFVVNRTATQETEAVLRLINDTYQPGERVTRPAAERLARALYQAAQRAEAQARG